MKIEEQFLHYIWKYQKFDHGDLKSTCGDPIKVFQTGTHNHDSGPDFEEAKVKIGDLEWAGNVEIHVKSSDWHKHGHGKDPSYENVILHVVWMDDQPVHLNGCAIPTIELESIVSQDSLNKYKQFIHTKGDIICAKSLKKIPELSFCNMIDRTMVERLERKSQEIQSILSRNLNDWESATYYSLAKSFGFSVNKEPFEVLVKSVPYKVISKYRMSLKSIEALIFGQAGFLDEPVDSYQSELVKEYKFLKKKHTLVQVLKRSNWKFSRMRPANFPSVRLAQFASFLSSENYQFSKLIETKNSKDFMKGHEVKMNSYWVQHYDFGKTKNKGQNGVGISTYQNVIINTVAPLLAAYSLHLGDYKYMEQAIQLLEELPAEQNRFTKLWSSVGKAPQNAFESQASIELYQSYCKLKKCLSCNIGVEIVS